MNLTPEQNVILIQLYRSKLLTEHELASDIAKATNRKEVDVVPHIGKWLTQLKTYGLVWSGQLSNGGGQQMWAATLTKNGRNIGRELSS